MIATTTTQREIIHWIWLWTLAAIVVSVMQGHLAGQSRDDSLRGNALQAWPADRGDVDPGQPIPMPNVDDPQSFRYPDEPVSTDTERVSLPELMQFHRLGQFDLALEGWKKIRIEADSRTWQQVGMGVSLMRLDRFDDALDHMEAAIKLDPTNAVAEYFIARIRQAQSRRVPPWDDQPRDETPFRLASHVESDNVVGLEPAGSQSRSDMRLPHFIDDAFRRLARKHFRRALMLAPKCDLEQLIRVESDEAPILQLASYRFGALAATSTGVRVGELLDSWGERDFVRKSQAELGVRPSPHLRGAISVAP